MNAAERTALEHYFQELAADLALSFSDGTCYLEGRAFPERALGQTATAQRENVSPRDFLPVIPESASGRPIQLLAQGAWEKKPGGSFKTHWKWGTADSPVSLQMFPDRLLLTVESMRGKICVPATAPVGTLFAEQIQLYRQASRKPVQCRSRRQINNAVVGSLNVAFHNLATGSWDLASQ